MDIRKKLRLVLGRLLLSARELELQPEAFQATVEIRLAAGDLAEAIRRLDEILPTLPESIAQTLTRDAGERPGARNGLVVRGLAPELASRSMPQNELETLSMVGTIRALARSCYLAVW